MKHGQIPCILNSIKWRFLYNSSIGGKKCLVWSSILSINPRSRIQYSTSMSAVYTSTPDIQYEQPKTQNTARELIELASGKTENALNQAEKLISSIPKSSLDIFDEFCELRRKSSTDEKLCLEFIILLLKRNILPAKSESTQDLLLLFCPQSNRTSGPEALLQNDKLFIAIEQLILLEDSIISWNFMRFIIKWTSIMPSSIGRFAGLRSILFKIYEKEQRYPNTSSISISNSQLWAEIIRTFRKTDSQHIANYLTALGVSTVNPDIEAAFILRIADITECTRSIHSFCHKWGETQHVPQLISHYAHLKAREGYFITAHDVCNIFKLTNIDDDIINEGSIRGAFGSGNYSQVIRIFQEIENNRNIVVYERTLKYYIGSLVKVGDLDKAISTFRQSTEQLSRTNKDVVQRDVRINDNALVHIIKGIISKGRVSYRGEKRPSSAVIPVDEGLVLIKSLLPAGFKLCASSYLSDIYVHMDHVDISYEDIRHWAYELARLLLIDLTKTQSERTLDYPATRQIVWWGFSKSPRSPWTSLDLLKKLQDAGINVSVQSIVDAYSHIISQLYSAKAAGPYLRIRRQMDPNMNLEQLIETVQQKWKDLNMRHDEGKN